MAQEDYIHGQKVDKNFRQDRGGVGGYSGPFEAEVMSTVDPTHSGRIEVWISAFGDENTKDHPASWTTARYLSPYYGVTEHKKIDAPDPNFETTGHAYGMWANVPDPGVKVLVVFSNGDRNKCYYIGFIPEPQMNQMVPAIGAKEDVVYSNAAQEEKTAHAVRSPVVEMDKKEASMKSAEFGNVLKPMHSVVAGQMWKQGLLGDEFRGPISSSAQRESPSYVYGISTPGRPIYSAGMFDHEVKQKLESGEETDTSIVGRRGGHTFVMDDGEVDGKNNLIRIRTSTGHQITMSDDGESIYIVHANGLSWWELGAEGTIDMYAANSINMRSGGEVNIHADTNVNINAGDNINLFSKNNTTLEAENSLVLTGKQNWTGYGGTIGIKSDGTLAVEAGAGSSFKAGGHTEIKAASIGLNNGSAESVQKPGELSQVNHQDVTKDDTVGFKEQSGKFTSIVSRAPTHEPWSGHNTGITNVKPFDKS
jgi:hypothetical protein